MKHLYLLLAIFIISACAHADPNTPEEINAHLKESMTKYLYDYAKTKSDSVKVKYDIQEVIYYPEKDYYLCEFKVRMQITNKLDTIGFMKANITKDYKNVTRTN
ncbi:hypothetical protein BH11BAC6_BH11BAC6_10890 [soil metagenome]